jgi:hydroxyacyl-ACP dehydratase HTD2-like protein with hotdog domain
MFIRSLLAVNVLPLRCFSSSALNILKTGDILRQRRVFTNEDVLQYSKVTHDSNPLHFDSELARNAGFEDRLVHGMLVAALFPRIISSHFVSHELFLISLVLVFFFRLLQLINQLLEEEQVKEEIKCLILNSKNIKKKKKKKHLHYFVPSNN